MLRLQTRNQLDAGTGATPVGGQQPAGPGVEAMTAAFLFILITVVWFFLSVAMLATLALMVLTPPKVWVPMLLVYILCVGAVIQSSEASFGVLQGQHQETYP